MTDITLAIDNDINRGLLIGRLLAGLEAEMAGRKEEAEKHFEKAVRIR